MQYTIRRIPGSVDKVIRERARVTGNSLNDVVIELLAIGSGVLVLGAAGLLDGADIAVATEAREWMTQALPLARPQIGGGLVASRQGQLITAADSSFALELGLTVVERCLGKRARQTLEHQLGHGGPLARLTLDPTQLKLPTR